MATRMMLEITDLDSSEVNIHVSARLSTRDSPNGYSSIDWIMEHPEYVNLTAIGEALLEELQVLSGAHIKYGPFGLVVQVPQIFDLIDTLFEIMGMVSRTVNDDVEFGTTLGEDAFTKPEFILSPTREQFGENIERMLAELRQHSTRDIAEARNLIKRLESLIECAESSVKSR